MSSSRRHLEALLRHHEPVDDAERLHLERMRRLLRQPGDVFSRDHFEPGHFTASAFVLSPDRQRVLLVLHGKLGRWLQPGGHIDSGDPTVTWAAVREVREETAASLDSEETLLDLDVHSIPARGSAPGHEHFDVRFLMRAVSESVVAGSDARQVRWVPLSEVDAPGLDSDESVLRAIRKVRNTRTI